MSVDEAALVNSNCLSSGEMESSVKNEQSLFIDTTEGLVVVTGCAHPGVLGILERAEKLIKKEVLFVIGGFHLMRSNEGSIREIASRMKKMGVRFVAPTHCSGDGARGIFKEVFGANYLDCGVGRVITAKDLTGASS